MGEEAEGPRAVDKLVSGMVANEGGQIRIRIDPRTREDCPASGPMGYRRVRRTETDKEAERGQSAVHHGSRTLDVCVRDEASQDPGTDRQVRTGHRRGTQVSKTWRDLGQLLS